ncbi:unnamed protein product [Dibothriocephalus latus]|uniref:Uncharacterized protein n=1 Tax=Dibothriocephalus latus TaxID=60516 RepID=A0A3P6QY13_DIBLA|nr:unnamed protein product [Dibothriocephalus latus]
MAIRVAMAPVNDLLSQVPRLPIWSASPGSGDATLPDLAYLPQEYVTQVWGRRSYICYIAHTNAIFT